MRRPRGRKALSWRRLHHYFRASMRSSRGAMRKRSWLLVIVADHLLLINGDGIVEDHTKSWSAANLADTLAAGHESALPPKLFEAVLAAAPTVQRESADGPSFKFGKHNTWWFPLFDSSGKRTQPRSAIEAAVHTLFDLDFGKAASSSSIPVIGGEWWLQERAPSENIGYHYDKDEAYASEHMTMRFPEVSTVTYLGDVGAPTLVFNQTTPDGNLEVPPLPVHGVLTYPSPNKHLVFRGNLQHGVSGELAIPLPDDAPPHPRRRTLLVNWWRYAPMPPNCIAFESERWERLGMRLDAAAIAALLRGGGATPRPFAWKRLTTEASSARKVVVEVAPTDQMYFSFPNASVMRPGNWHVQWARGEALGPIARLDLKHSRSMNAIFTDKRPKLFLVLPSRSYSSAKNSDKPPTNWASSLPKWLYALHERYGEAIKFVFAEPRESSDFMIQFGLGMSDVPTAVIHDNYNTINDRSKAKRHGAGKYKLNDKLRKATVVKFVEDFFAKRLRAVGETSEKGELRRSRRLSVRSAPASYPNWTLPNLHRHAARHSAAYAVARPFPHAVIDNLFPPSSLAALSDEIPEKMLPSGCIPMAQACYKKPTTHYKKSELHWDAMGPYTRQLFSMLRGKPFVRFLEGLSGVRGLIPDPGFEGSGVHLTGNGGILAVHHDFNWMECTHDASSDAYHACSRPNSAWAFALKKGFAKKGSYNLKRSDDKADQSATGRVRLHRRVNIFVYLNHDWPDSYGGHLELWARNMSRCEQRIRVSFGRLAVFSSTDFSFHGHPKPLRLPDGRMRRSIAFYYYTHGRPTDECEEGDCETFRNAEWKKLGDGCASCTACAPPGVAV